MSERAPQGMPVPHLRAWRVWSVLSQKELAEKANLDPITVTLIESGSIASFKTIGKLADAMKITRKDLIHSLPENDKVAV